MILVRFYPQNQNPKRLAKYYAKGIELKPGNNLFSGKEEQIILKDKAFLALKEKGIITVEEKEKALRAKEKALIEKNLEFSITSSNYLELEEKLKKDSTINFETVDTWIQEEKEGKNRQKIIGALNKHLETFF